MLLTSINWSDVLTNVISSLLVAIITAAVGALFVKKYASQLNFSKKMSNIGFTNTSTNKQSKREIAQMCNNAVIIKIINVSGFHYLNANEELLKKALERGAKVQFLCADPNSNFLSNIENMEYHKKDISGKRLREKDKKISAEIYDLIEKYQGVGLDIRFYSTEYRLPFVLAYYKDGSIKAWLTITLPPYKSTKSFVLRGEKKAEQFYDDDINFVDMMETNFDVIWEHSSKSLQEIARRQNGKQCAI